MHTARQLIESKPPELFSVAPESPVFDAIARMAEHQVGALLVMRAQDLVGIVSERDYARKVILQGRSSRETAVREIMSTPVHTAAPDESVKSLMRRMTDLRVRHLPVVDGDQVLGMLSIGDLVKAVISEQQDHIDHLERFIMG